MRHRALWILSCLATLAGRAESEEIPFPYQPGQEIVFRSQWEGEMKAGVAGLAEYHLPVRLRGEHRWRWEKREDGVEWILRQHLAPPETPLPPDLPVEAPPTYERPEARIRLGADGKMQQLVFSSPIAHPTQYLAVVAGSNLDIPLALAYLLSRPEAGTAVGQTWRRRNAEGEPFFYTLEAERVENQEMEGRPALRWKVRFEFLTQRLLPPAQASEQAGTLSAAGVYRGEVLFWVDARTFRLLRLEGEVSSQLQVLAMGVLVDVSAKAQGKSEEEPQGGQP